MRTSKSTPHPFKDGSSRSSSASGNALDIRDLRLGRRVCGVSLFVAPGEIVTIVGPSGAGKTSLLRAVVGLEQPEAGDVHLGGASVLEVPPARRRIAFVQQEETLFPHMTLAQNLAFGMRCVDERRVRETAHELQIASLLEKKPMHVSGGERRRAALARALLSDPYALLLDEPLAHLDPQVRASARELIVHRVSDWGGPAIFVTHDREEALLVGDRVVILMQGAIVQSGTPQEVYERPATLDAARFFGAPFMNVLDDRMSVLAVRPEHVSLDDASPLRGPIVGVDVAGADRFVHVRTPRGAVVARLNHGDAIAPVGSEIGVRFDERYVLRYAADGKLL